MLKGKKELIEEEFSVHAFLCLKNVMADGGDF